MLSVEYRNKKNNQTGAKTFKDFASLESWFNHTFYNVGIAPRIRRNQRIIVIDTNILHCKIVRK